MNRLAAWSLSIAVAVAFGVTIPAAVAVAGEHGAPKAQAPMPEFDRVKALVGEWEGTAKQPGSEKSLPTRAVYSVVSGGSVVMLVTDPGGKYEMVTMFHRDGDALLATHYCSAQNQPRMKLKAGAAGQRLDFEFMDGTNLRDYPGRMQSVALVFVDPDHHLQEWTSLHGEKTDAMVFDLVRKKQ